MERSKCWTLVSRRCFRKSRQQRSRTHPLWLALPFRASFWELRRICRPNKQKEGRQIAGRMCGPLGAYFLRCSPAVPYLKGKRLGRFLAGYSRRNQIGEFCQPIRRKIFDGYCAVACRRTINAGYMKSLTQGSKLKTRSASL